LGEGSIPRQKADPLRKKLTKGDFRRNRSWKREKDTEWCGYQRHQEKGLQNFWETYGIAKPIQGSGKVRSRNQKKRWPSRSAEPKPVANRKKGGGLKRHATDIRKWPRENRE